MSSVSKLNNMKWRKITAPTPWHPKDGDELIGYYGGRTKKDGRFGQYEVLLVYVPYKGAYTISGTGILQLADAAMISRGDALRIIFEGKKQLDEGHEKKLFALYVGELEREADLPVEPTAGTPS